MMTIVASERLADDDRLVYFIYPAARLTTDHIAGVEMSDLENGGPVWTGFEELEKCSTWKIKDRSRIFCRRQITTTSA